MPSITKRSLAALCCLLWGLAVPALAEEAAPLLVRVTDGDGKPVAGATVRASPQQNLLDKPGVRLPVVRVETAADGTARLSGLPADRTLWVLAESQGHAPELRSLPVGSLREMRLPLGPGRLLVGQVVDEKGRPVAGAEVTLAGTPFPLVSDSIHHLLSHQGRHQVRTGPAGRFRFRDLPDGLFELSILHPDYAILDDEQAVEGSAIGRLGTFVLRQGTVLRGTVTGADGSPVAGARVWALSRTEQRASDEAFAPPSATTADDGSFSIPGRPSGQKLDFWVCADGFLQEWSSIDFPEDPVQVRLLPAASIHGRVLGPDGSPLAGARVSACEGEEMGGCGNRVATPCLEGEPATSDAEGRFHLARLSPAWYTVTAQAPGLVNAEVSPVRAAAGEPMEVEIRFPEGATVSGRVTAPDGSPLPGADVWVRSEKSAVWMTAREDGSFRVSGVAAGPNEIVARADGYEDAERLLEVSGGLSGGEIRADLVLTPEEEKKLLEIRGRVAGPDGAPVEGARVSLGAESIHSSWDGSFTLRACDCQAGPYEIQAEKRGFAPGVAPVSAKGGERVEGVEIRLETGTRIIGRVTGLPAEDLRGVAIQLMNGDVDLPTFADAEGRFEIGPVGAGTWEAQAYLDSRSAIAEVITEPGQPETFVELPFAPVRQVSGRVLDSDGDPLARTEVTFHSKEELFASTWSRADGSFSAAVPEGELSASVWFQGIRQERPVGAERGPVSGLEIRLERGVRVGGRILGIPPWEGVTIRLEGPGNLWADVDVDGLWSAQGIPPGRWDLTATREATSQEIQMPIEVPGGASEIVIDLDFTGTEGDFTPPPHGRR